MCTVTFIPTDKGIYLTSSRDEHSTRSKALPPQLYSRNGQELIFPKDPDAGGTWIALSNRKDAAVLLNGAFTKPTLRLPAYRRSRGLVLLDVLMCPDPVAGFRTLSLSGIAPFTLILFFRDSLTECRWDGTEKYQKQLDTTRPQIWSSATLYDETAVKQREQWFTAWLQQQLEITAEDVLQFHQTAGKGDVRNSVLMNRDNTMRTVSITTLSIGRQQSRIRYRDVQKATDYQSTFPADPPQPVTSDQEGFRERWYSRIRRAGIRIAHWEYWPSGLLYAPVSLYWLWLSIKARSFFFFSAANPSIPYAGFTQERKSDIYKLIPSQYQPRTVLCRPGTAGVGLREAMTANGISFPAIAKPDIGERGVQVKLLPSLAELEAYSRNSKVDFLLQEYIAYEQEAGIFYYRVPGTSRGYISGIVEKTFLKVTGDGKATIAQLLKSEQRSFLQLPVLKTTYGKFLDTVLAAGEQYTLVPYGNHSRGARFTDASYRITEELTAAIDHICRQIPGFYYGRLDIKFKSWDTLSRGKELSVIELNGAGSEPTHIYDPAHSLFFAWKEISRHWELLYRISHLNARRKGLALMSFSDGIRMRRDRSRYLKLISP